MSKSKLTRKLNAGRAKRAEFAVDAYIDCYATGNQIQGEAEKKTAVRDLLTDLMHLAQRPKYRCDFENELKIARIAFDAETQS